MKASTTNQNIPEHVSIISELIIKCQENMAANGLPCNEDLILDGDRQHYTADDNPKKDEWYIGSIEMVQGELVLTCTYSSWSTGEKFTYRSSNTSNISHKEINFEEMNDLKRGRELVRAAKEAETKLKHDRVARLISAEYQGTKKSSPRMNLIPWKAEDTRYFRSKGIKQHESPRWPIRFHRYVDPVTHKAFRCMVIPIINIDNEVRSVEYIYYEDTSIYDTSIYDTSIYDTSIDNGKCVKRFHAGGEKRGNFYPIGEFNDIKQIYIVEGYATGASIFEALLKAKLNGTCAKPKHCVVVAFDAGNICPVVGNLRKKFSSQEIIVCTDDDEAGKSNTDLACQLYNCKKGIVPTE